MIIQELYMKHFGQFTDKRLTLQPGVNLIFGGNEAGKSTAAEFVRGMLFGMKKARGRGAGKDAFSRYSPWEGTLPEGSLRFVCRDRHFCISRRFPDQAELFCTDDGEVLDVAGGDLLMLLGGVREGLYRNSCCADGQDTAVDAGLTQALTSYLVTMESTREEQADVEAAEQWLKRQERELQADVRKQSEIRRERMEVLCRRIEYLEEEKERLRKRLAEDGGKQSEQKAQRRSGAERPKSEAAGRGALAGAALAAFGTVLFLLSAVLAALDGRYALSAGNALLSCVLLLLAAYMGKRPGKRRTDQELPELEEMKDRLYREQLLEELEEREREQEDRKEELRILEQPTEKEAGKQLELDACRDAEERIRSAAMELSGAWAVRLEQEASRILASVTAGRYRGLKIKDRMEVTVTDGQRIYRPEQLSTGTKEQIRVSVRLSSALLLTEEPLPLLFDDAFLAWDEGRLERLLCWLPSCERQILLFTGQKREEELLDRNNLPYHKIVLDE